MPLNEAQLGQLKQIASMAYGVKYGYGSAGGKGYIGMLGDKVVKFGTHVGERGGAASDEMCACCNALRDALGTLASDVYGTDRTALDAFRKKLGLPENKASAPSKELLTRSVVAKAVTELVKKGAGNSKGFWRDVAAQKGDARPVSQKKTDFKTVQDNKTKKDLEPYTNVVNDKAFLRFKEVVEHLDLDAQVKNLYNGNGNKTKNNILVSVAEELKKEPGGDENFKFLCRMSKALDDVVVNGKIHRGEMLRESGNPTLDDVTKDLSEANKTLVRQSVNHTVNFILNKFEAAKKKAADGLVEYAGLLNRGFLDGRDEIEKQVARNFAALATIYKEPEGLLGLQADRTGDEVLDFKKDKNLAWFLDMKYNSVTRAAYANELKKSLTDEVRGKVENMKKVKGNVQAEKNGQTEEEKIYGWADTLFLREYGSPELASQLTIDGVNQKDVYEDTTIRVRDELKDAIHDNTQTEGGYRMLQSFGKLVPQNDPAHDAIMFLLTRVCTPVSGLYPSISKLCDCGYGVQPHYAKRARISIDGFINHEFYPPTVAVTRNNDALNVEISGLLGMNVGPGDIQPGVAVFLPKENVTYNLRIPLNQKELAGPEDLKFDLDIEFKKYLPQQEGAENVS